ncbi:unnamed protein product [Ilex paraguariensis]|uniref:SREBP regulating gene protein n=1 Tax=Ilex paraguariensis TaxID=185542 RepID=A0ABC8TRP5_9AQUA
MTPLMTQPAFHAQFSLYQVLSVVGCGPQTLNSDFEGGLVSKHAIVASANTRIQDTRLIGIEEHEGKQTSKDALYNWPLEKIGINGCTKDSISITQFPTESEESLPVFYIVGHVCDALSVDPESRCCPVKGEQFSCHGCSLVSQCCDSYEFCVSCCLHPARTQEALALKVKIAKPVTAGTYSSLFDFCAGRCRHNSQSVVHENAYLSDFHHCFSMAPNSSGECGDVFASRIGGNRRGSLHGVKKSQRFQREGGKRRKKKEERGDLKIKGGERWGLVVQMRFVQLDVLPRYAATEGSDSGGSTDVQMEARLAGISVIIGRQGESCDFVCKSNGKSCLPNKLALLNQCEIFYVADSTRMYREDELGISLSM